MTSTYWKVIIAYIIMQFSALVGIPLLVKLGLGNELDYDARMTLLFSYWTTISFTLGLLIILWLLRKDFQEKDLRGPQSSIFQTIIWSILGFWMALFGQGIATMVQQQLFGIEPGSENTQQIMEFISSSAAIIFAVAIAGPILEEIIFRKIIFGVLYKKYNFAVGLIVSSLLFAVVHQEFEHLLIYFVMGAIFAFLYVKTNRIIVPIIAHVSMNSFVVLVQQVFREDIERQLEQLEQMQSFIYLFL